ncbi:MAG TPA: DUF6152 family protein [Candidatus Acidoferrum sp.]|nr:DUF6152 family protein [Candidatus Acidoferrum sp.]
MKSALIRSAIAVAALLAAAPAVQAHHSFSMFDRDTQQVITGTVARWAFNNPHSWLYINVKNADGSDTLWSFEGASPTQLIGRGITGNTVKPGDTVTMMYCPLADKRPGGAIGWIKIPDGTFLNPADGGCRTDDAGIARWKEWLDKGFKSNKEAQGQASN